MLAVLLRGKQAVMILCVCDMFDILTMAGDLSRGLYTKYEGWEPVKPQGMNIGLSQVEAWANNNSHILCAWCAHTHTHTHSICSCAT